MEFLYHDDDLLVINKPAGLLTIPDGYDHSLPCVKRLLEHEFGKCYIVHRLDKETSGTLIVARNATTHRLLNTQFQEHQVIKRYHAIIHGQLECDDIEIKTPLRVNGDRNHRTVVDHLRGKPAITKITSLDKFFDFSLVLAIPLTGYTHQIRSHLASIHHPLLGDSLYQKGQAAQSSLPAGMMQRVALHAHQITFIHPSLLTPLTLTAEYPSDFRGTLDWLKK